MWYRVIDGFSMWFSVMMNGYTHRGWWCRSAGDPTQAACSSDCDGRLPARQSEPASSSWRAGPWQPLRRSATRDDRILVRDQQSGGSAQQTAMHWRHSVRFFKAHANCDVVDFYTCILGGQIHHLFFLLATHPSTQGTWDRKQHTKHNKTPHLSVCLHHPVQQKSPLKWYITKVKALLGHNSYEQTTPLGGTVHQFWSTCGTRLLPENTCD